MTRIEDLVNEDTYYMIDIDGVCIDTEERICNLAAIYGWKNVFDIVNWHEHIYSSKQIRGSLDILKEVQTRLKRIQLLTQNHSKEEEYEKISFFRQNGILIPIVSVPAKISKSTIIPPSFYNGNVVLVDDREKNIIDWNQNGGIALHFTEEETPYQRVKTLEFLKHVK